MIHIMVIHSQFHLSLISRKSTLAQKSLQTKKYEALMCGILGEHITEPYYPDGPLTGLKYNTLFRDTYQIC
jgi:hypothetical protein